MLDLIADYKLTKNKTKQNDWDTTKSCTMSLSEGLSNDLNGLVETRGDTVHFYSRNLRVGTVCTTV